MVYIQISMKTVLFLVVTLSAVADAEAPKAPRFEITVTKQGFEPESVNVPANKPVTLVFTRKTQATCTKQIVLTMADGKKIERALPLDTAVEIPVTFPKAGKLGYACGMDMNKGVIVVH
jgi:plastocyanin domain-containing protein